MHRNTIAPSAAALVAIVAAGLVAYSPIAQAQTWHFTGYWRDNNNQNNPSCEMWLTPNGSGYDAIYKCAGGGGNRDYPTTWTVDRVEGDTIYLTGASGEGHAGTGWMTPTHHHVDYSPNNGTIEGDGSNGSTPDVTIDTFEANPTSITAGGSSTLSWTTSNASSVSIDQGIGDVAGDGSQTVTPGSTTTYTLTADGQGGPLTRQVTVNVNVPAGVRIDSFSASPSTIVSGQSATLSWATSNATSASIDQGVGGVNVNGSMGVSPASTTTYTLTAEGTGGPATQQVTLTVLADSDGDELPDDWEATYGLDPFDPDTDGDSIEDPDDDEDGDGYTNRSEYLDGSDPTDPESYPGASGGSSSSGISCAAGLGRASALATLLWGLAACAFVLRRRPAPARA